METCYEYYTDEKWACISSDEKKVINRIMELHEAHPDEVVISNRPESNQGVMVAKIPRTFSRVLTNRRRSGEGNPIPIPAICPRSPCLAI